MSQYPWFAAQLPAGTYNLRIVYLATPADITITIANHYLIPDVTHDRSVLKLLLTALQTVDASFTVAASLSTAKGYELDISAGDLWYIDYANTATTNAGKFDLRWIGLANADTSSSDELITTQQPSYCWSPRAPIDDRGWTPYRWQAYTTMTESGRAVTVNHEARDPYTVRKQWRHIVLDTTRGVDGGRLQLSRLSDGAFDWATPAGASSTDPFPPLDAPGGWWSATVGGTPWIVITDMASAGVEGAFDTDYLYGPYEFAYAGGPCPMDGWLVLGPPNVVKVSPAGGYRSVEFCAIESTDYSL